MKVYLAGYNIDAEVLEELKSKSEPRDDVTPEVISAAYARISRDPRPVNELRKDARSEVEKTRKSNKTIIFKMGHHSVAEHAVFNLDILGVSRLSMEEIEKFRLCSYTEKSQRYITLDKGFVVPQEVKGTRLEDEFVKIIQKQNQAYTYLFKQLKEHEFKKHSQLANDPKNHSLLEGWAKEDARYVTGLSTESQVGLTVNARNLELMLRRFASHHLLEVNNLGKAIYDQIKAVAPSILIFYEANARDKNTYPELKKTSDEVVKKVNVSGYQNLTNDVQLSEFTENGDNVIVAALLHSSTSLPYGQCKKIVECYSSAEKENIFKAAWRNLQFYDSLPREFEYVNLTFDIELSAACFGQLKRHRMSTITTQGYDPLLGVIIPESINEIGQAGYFQEIIEQTNRLHDELKKEIPQVASYILTNAHKRRALIRVNARELYHISRLREDSHAQWDIQNISHAMTEQAKKVMPLVFRLIGGKDQYNQTYKAVFKKLPKVIQAVLPEARKIK